MTPVPVMASVSSIHRSGTETDLSQCVMTFSIEVAKLVPRHGNQVRIRLRFE